jgi:hypothetical protein
MKTPHALACLLSATVVALGTVGCGSGSETAAVSPVKTTPTLTKAPLHGLVSMNDESFVNNTSLTPNNSQAEPSANPHVYVASVILVTWSQLQPTNGSSLNSVAIESGLSAIAT